MSSKQLEKVVEAKKNHGLALRDLCMTVKVAADEIENYIDLYPDFIDMNLGASNDELQRKFEYAQGIMDDIKGVTNALNVFVNNIDKKRDALLKEVKMFQNRPSI